MAGVKRFEDLVAWQRSRSLCVEIYRVTGSFPSDERFGLVSQMRRACVSIPSNIAEGFGRQTTPDFVRYLRMARGSLFEVQTQALIAVDLGFMTEAELPSELIAECDRVLQALIRSLEERV